MKSSEIDPRAVEPRIHLHRLVAAGAVVALVACANNTSHGTGVGSSGGAAGSSAYGRLDSGPDAAPESASTCPSTCQELGATCGTATDTRCGGVVQCGSCPSGEACGVDQPNVCTKIDSDSGTCRPTSCAAEGKNCGHIDDGCGNLLNCGACAAPDTCGGGGTVNVCGSGNLDTGGISGSVCWGASGFWNFDIGRTENGQASIRFKASVSGVATAIRFYASGGSHAVWNFCNNSSSCITTCGGDPSCYGQYATTCETNYSGCYSAGTGGVIQMELVADDGTPNHNPSNTVLASATVVHPVTVYGFRSTYPNLGLSSSVTITAGRYYHIVFKNIDPDYAKNWYSVDSFTPSDCCSSSSVKLAGATQVDVLTKTGSGGWSVDSRFSPIFNVALSDGGRIGAGFCN